RFGNFADYYAFHPPEERLGPICIDVLRERLKLSSEERNDPFLICDVGSNEGKLTEALLDLLQTLTDRPVHVLGLDIDAALIRRAQARVSAGH
ncbi:unnamed protein product, partial [Phaeothamnion confervicola]